MTRERLNVLVIDPSAVELIEDESLQEDFRGVCIPRKVRTELPKSCSDSAYFLPNATDLDFTSLSVGLRSIVIDQRVLLHQG